jgi:hypothetical protein
MFSVPPPLPRPTGPVSSAFVRDSNTATLQYPTHQTITTPESSRARGDWGVKRPLPLRATTKTSTPLIRVESIDTIEHITQFASAADHALTLKKWQEMNIPLTTPKPTQKTATGMRSRVELRSVFEDDIDVTAAEDTVQGKASHRWKFSGPWLAGQSEGEFNDFLVKSVRKRKVDFHRYLRQQLVNRVNKEAQRKAIENGEDVQRPVRVADISEDQLQHYIKELREDQTELFQHIRKFFDLAPSPASASGLNGLVNEIERSGTLGFGPVTIDATKTDDPKSDSPYAAAGPPKTHPSAGLSYLRTSSNLFNHPVYGPQSQPPPVKARLVQPRNGAVGAFAPKLGVAGIVTEVPPSIAFNSFNMANTRSRGSRNESISSIDPDIVGGTKLYVQPRSASIDPEGRILLETSEASEASVSVHEGKVGKTLFIESTRPDPFGGHRKGGRARFGSANNDKTEAEHDLGILRNRAFRGSR